MVCILMDGWRGWFMWREERRLWFMWREERRLHGGSWESSCFWDQRVSGEMFLNHLLFVWLSKRSERRPSSFFQASNSLYKFVVSIVT
mmetsp:Transcript_8873/g.16635  ORF Transcript_8873/g.16635 Transcript_8873/m.16635 type:complete len:88 (+) Transcript_8873:1597-1860(+)